MRFKKAIVLSVYVYTEEELKLRELDLDNENMGCNETESRAFWCIDSAHRDKDDHSRTIFYSSGEGYMTPIKFRDFIEIVNGHIQDG